MNESVSWPFIAQFFRLKSKAKNNRKFCVLSVFGVEIPYRRGTYGFFCVLCSLSLWSGNPVWLRHVRCYLALAPSLWGNYEGKVSSWKKNIYLFRKFRED